MNAAAVCIHVSVSLHAAGVPQTAMKLAVIARRAGVQEITHAVSHVQARHNSSVASTTALQQTLECKYNVAGCRVQKRQQQHCQYEHTEANRCTNISRIICMCISRTGGSPAGAGRLRPTKPSYLHLQNQELKLSRLHKFVVFSTRLPYIRFRIGSRNSTTRHAYVTLTTREAQTLKLGAAKPSFLDAPSGRIKQSDWDWQSEPISQTQTRSSTPPTRRLLWACTCRHHQHQGDRTRLR